MTKAAISFGSPNWSSTKALEKNFYCFLYFFKNKLIEVQRVETSSDNDDEKNDKNIENMGHSFKISTYENKVTSLSGQWVSRQKNEEILKKKTYEQEKVVLQKLKVGKTWTPNNTPLFGDRIHKSSRSLCYSLGNFSYS